MIKPCFTGWFTSAEADAFGTEPSPASLENKPRLIPCITAAPMKPPVAESIVKACVKIAEITSGNTEILEMTMYKAIKKYKPAIKGTKNSAV